MNQIKKLEKLLNLARKQIDEENWSAALSLMLQAKKIEPRNYSLLFQLGWAYLNLSRLSDARNYFYEVEKIVPKNSVVLNSVAIAYMQLKLWPDALRVLLRCMELDSTKIGTYLNLSTVYYQIQEHKKSLDVSMKALLVEISNPHIHLNMGAAFLELGFLSDARVSFQTCIELDPNFLSAKFNLAMLFGREGDINRSIEEFKSYLIKADAAKDPNINAAKFFQSGNYLTVGKIKEGWSLYEYGFDPTVPSFACRSPRRSFNAPKWAGQQIQDGKLLVWGEQGIGDEILFLSCLKDVFPLCKNIILECQPRLVSLMTRTFPNILVRPSAYDQMNFNQAVFNDFDYHIPMGSLPGFYRNDILDFKDKTPFIIVDKTKKELFSSRLKNYNDHLKVGICWRSGTLNATRNRDYSAIKDWHQLLKLPNCVFINLQYGDCEEEIIEAEALLGIKILRWDDLNLKDDMESVFALVECLDVVVTAPTAVNTIAGSLGVKTILLQGYRDWPNCGTNHWPWYPNTECFIASNGASVATFLPQVTAIVANLRS
jgi:Flp pilus assembly protein TadD